MDHPTARLQTFLSNVVVPHQRVAMNVIPDHITMLDGVKSKKQLSRKKRAHKSTTLTRLEYSRLGLNCLPRLQMKYEDVVPLHRLWKCYMREHINIKEGGKVPEVHDRNYEAFSKLLIKTDLHGAKIQVIQSKCPTLVGLAGICVMDTKNVLKLLGKDNRLRTIPKTQCVFAMKFGNMEFTIFGQHSNIRPAERSVKKIKTNIEPFM